MHSNNFSRQAIIYPQAGKSFTINDSSQCFTGNFFTFTPIIPIIPKITSHLWNFGDSYTDTSKATTHKYSIPDTFTVKLFTVTADGCKDTSSKNVYVNPMPKADISVNDSSQCLKGNSFVFINSNPLSIINNQCGLVMGNRIPDSK